MAQAMALPSDAWQLPPASRDLPDDVVDVWQVSLNASESVVGRLWSVLAADERTRAGRFHFKRDHDRYVTARGTLRLLLANYLERSATDVRFGYTEFGKPYVALTDGAPAPHLDFNVSHSQDVALLAFARARRVGVDVEQIRPELAEGRIAERFFSPREVAALRALAPTEQTPAFFRCWTRKEAFVKARGEGLSLPLNRFDVSLAPDEPPALLRTLDDPTEVARWSLYALEPASPGYMAALAVEGARCELRHRRIDAVDSSFAF